MQHGFADSFEMKCTYGGPQVGDWKWSTWDDEFFSRTMGWSVMEIHGLLVHAATPLTDARRNTRNPISSPRATDTHMLDTSVDETTAHMPATEARKHRSAVARVVCMAQDRPDL